MNNFKYILSNTLTWKILILNFSIFILINLLHWINPIITQYFFLNIPWYISPGMVLWNFSHYDIIHFLFNSYWLFILWPIIERVYNKRVFLKLIIVSMIVTIIWVQLFSPAAVLWFSWILMWLITFIFFNNRFDYTIDKKFLWFFLVLNIWIWFLWTISLTWHIFWAAWWYLYYWLLKRTNNL